jgi:tRNA nucleotidyltransferase (CCA-adding enzyme)
MKRETMTKPAIAPAPAAAPAEAASKADKAEAKKGPMTPAEQEQAFRQRQQDAAKASKEADEKANQAKIKEQNCNNARQRLATYSFGGRISKIDANGERYYVEDSEIAAGKAQAQADIASMCN